VFHEFTYATHTTVNYTHCNNINIIPHGGKFSGIVAKVAENTEENFSIQITFFVAKFSA
jgi:hypothetical protein